VRVAHLVAGEAALPELGQEPVAGEAVVDLAWGARRAAGTTGAHAVGPERHGPEATDGAGRSPPGRRRSIRPVDAS
jgi:hypothetical protein